jgi:hypothetical protein
LGGILNTPLHFQHFLFLSVNNWRIFDEVALIVVTRVSYLFVICLGI